MSYSKSGELYGLLREGLGFGELLMFQGEGPWMCYQWSLRIRGKRVSTEMRVELRDFEVLAVSDIAWSLLNQFRSEAHELSGTVTKK